MLTTLTATSVPKRCIKSLSLRLSDFQENINENADHIRTCEMIVCTAKQIISYAIEDGYMTKNVTLRLKAPKRKGKKNYPGRRPLTNLEINAIEKADLDKKQRAYIELASWLRLTTGRNNRPEALKFQLDEEYCPHRRSDHLRPKQRGLERA